MKKKAPVIFISIFGTVFLSFVIFAFNNPGKAEPVDKVLFQKDNLDFWVITDTHYIDEELYDSGEAFQRIQMTTAGKDLNYQKESLQALITDAAARKPDGLIVTGDITLNGEYVSAQKFAEILSPLKDSGIETFVIPGNHDIYDGWARSFLGKEQEKIDQISPTDFQELFAESGYAQAAVRDDSSLSYLVQINDEYDFMFLDTNIYTNDSSNRAPMTAGKIDSKTQKWMSEQLKISFDKGKKTLVFMHHNLFEHNAVVSKGYVLNNAEEIGKLLQEFKVSVVFSGHIHAQDILTNEATGITEIVTGSFAITPNPVGIIELEKDKLTYSRKKTDVDQWAKKQSLTDENILGHSTYLKELFIKDSRRMGYSTLLENSFYEDEALDKAVELVSRLNVRFFTGEDDISDKEAEEIRKSEAYKIIYEESSFLKEYLDSIIQDTNENDLFFEKEFIKP
ncbi:metallophosphoesterase [Enterococcus sp. CWB-B31]|uniref:metallophosphoesterase n=1 Tax=Enterococcus sp. CWB-B31 TaxID=2885159 RepID=UPI001E2A85C1|nr:metallophosphoesterase [Enterococcus sp. CWB-B31]MCB5954718.1 metallophosphoesterase [Enterococcus sp. CWB-B31]